MPILLMFQLVIVKDDIPVEMICGYVVYDQSAKEKSLSWGISEKMIFNELLIQNILQHFS